MADSNGPDIGRYAPDAPAFNVSQYDTLPKLLNYTGGLLDRIDHDREWYIMDGLVQAATKKLGEVNDAFSAQLNKANEMLKGEAGDAFYKWGHDLWAKSDALYNQLNNLRYHDAIGNTGHAIRAFYDNWWHAVEARDDKIKQGTRDIRNAAYAAAEQATTVDDVDAITKTAQNALDLLKKNSDDSLVKELQGYLTGLISQ
ncbi:hypothetical protein, partial [Amycolatopsis sp. NPDC059021]|uniref:hypothetical protein n=1 Tax=Amycolatopsis sp. NPDC059021 TaxID=3346704 RepID=UPI0036704BE0